MEQLGIKSFGEITSRINSKLGVEELRYLLWAGLQRHHPDLTEKDVGAMDWDLIDAVKLIAEGFTRSLLRKTPPPVEKKVVRRTGTGS